MDDYFVGAEKLFLAVYITTFITGLPMNIIALYVFIAKFRQRLVPVDILLFNLTVSDLLLLLFLPFRMVEAASGMLWPMPYNLCPLSGFIYFSSIYLTTMFLSLVSVERYLGVAYPVKYKVLRKPIYYIISSVSIWVASTAHCSVVYIVEFYLPLNDTNNNFTATCYTKFSNEQLAILLPVRFEMCLVLFLAPFIITSFCYGNFIKIIMSKPYMSKARKHRAIGLVVTTFLNYVICFTPYNVSHIIGYIQRDSPSWRVYALLLSTFNACVDPIIFYYSSSSFQKTCRMELLHVLKTLHLDFCNFKTNLQKCDSETEETQI